MPVPDERFMRMALRLAAKAAAEGEVPVGCVVVDREGGVVGRGFNRREGRQDPLGHAEIYALRQAARRTGSWRLERCTLYVTLEPCAMCAGAIVLSRAERVVFAVPDPKAGFCGSLGNLVQDRRLNHRAALEQGVLADEARAMMKGFFKALRKRKSQESKR
jgi:tRNA(adenine34) deaminase